MRASPTLPTAQLAFPLSEAHCFKSILKFQNLHFFVTLVSANQVEMSYYQRFPEQCVCVYSVTSVVSDSLQPHGLQCTRLLSVQGILQARTLEWVAVSSSRGSSQPRDQTHVSSDSCTGRQLLDHGATWEAPLQSRVSVEPSISSMILRCRHIQTDWDRPGQVPALPLQKPLTSVVFSFLTCVFAQLCFSSSEVIELRLCREWSFGILVNGEGTSECPGEGGKPMS